MVLREVENDAPCEEARTVRSTTPVVNNPLAPEPVHVSDIHQFVSLDSSGSGLFSPPSVTVETEDTVSPLHDPVEAPGSETLSSLGAAPPRASCHDPAGSPDGPTLIISAEGADVVHHGMVPYTLATNSRVFSHHVDIELVDILREDLGKLATPDLFEHTEPTGLDNKAWAMDDKAQAQQTQQENR
ncbi:hypothetical protein SARC_07906 [Sphaeroforma arctica JP610]|uniref:Uncharacterized protein n=1 Tax=Sphaeroforma arctica JP610 TaxID=667725 RepID=A0A0L0FSD6_9EUKA|nr:hypothetical protein SARC_07906 [Sphaeroforma arctica JP610]KNC79712.1 hypothetical protein SARC_07906 [Sphaeroforma arctica JP610]|eukprot:XP_014153614.1 hypothetical protein SARC_07906 [Sphaeroforma arctica JP610]